MIVGLEGYAELVVKDSQIAVSIARNRLRHDRLHFLCDHPDIGFIAAVVIEAIETKTVVEVAEQDEVVLEPDIGPPTASSSTARAHAATAAAHTAAAALGPAARSTTGTCRSALARTICRSLLRLTVPRTWPLRLAVSRIGPLRLPVPRTSTQRRAGAGPDGGRAEVAAQVAAA